MKWRYGFFFAVVAEILAMCELYAQAVIPALMAISWFIESGAEIVAEALKKGAPDGE